MADQNQETSLARDPGPDPRDKPESTDRTTPRTRRLSDDEAADLRRQPLLRELSDDDALAIWPHVQVMTLLRGRRLYSQGDIGDRLYVVIDGKVKMTKTAPDGREVLVRIEGPGGMFGELAMFDPAIRTATATAITDTLLAGLAHEDFREVLETRPAVAMHMLRTLAKRLRETTETTTNLIFSDVPGRVAKALLELGDRFGVEQDEGILVSHDLTQEELAQLVGASRETVNKALADFATRGWIQLYAKSVLLLDRDRLRRRARLGSRRPRGEDSSGPLNPRDQMVAESYE